MASADGLLGQVSQLWSMLDDLRDNDPAGYRKLLQAQLEEGADLRSKPERRCSLRTQVLEPGRGPLYVNICSWGRVPAPQEPSGPLPVRAGELETSAHEGGYAVLDVALNPAALRDVGAETVRALALRFARKHCGLRVSEDFAVVGCSPNSSPDQIHRRLGFRQKPGACEQPVEVSRTPADLLRQISSFNAERQGEGAAAAVRRPAESKSRDLIQVISSVDAEPREPPYRLQLKAGAAGGPRRVLLTAELPEVSSVSECRLTISKDDVLLEAGGLYRLRLDFPAAVDEDTASAVFSRKRRTLALTVDAP